MQWALVATQTQSLTIYNQPIMDINNIVITPGSFSTIQAIPGTILNFIVYDGVAAYNPPTGMKLEQVPDNAKIGDTGF
jgi:hypothetical protein